MEQGEIDLLAIERGSITAPAGCGKTHLIVLALKHHASKKPALILTHTNAGVAALRARLKRGGIPTTAYRLSTLDGWAIRLLTLFPTRAAHDPVILSSGAPDYPKIRRALVRLLSEGHITNLLATTYDRLIVDEYQDCSLDQHRAIVYAADALPTCVLGDPMQAIFNFKDQVLVDWEKHVRTDFPEAGELRIPWRWKNAGTEHFGLWLLDARTRLIKGGPLDLSRAPDEVTHVPLNGIRDQVRQISAATPHPLMKHLSVLIIGKSNNRASQQQFASQIPGASLIENVELRDLIQFASKFDPTLPGALEELVCFAGSVVTGVKSKELLRRVESLRDGRARKAASSVERSALVFCSNPSFDTARGLLIEIGSKKGSRIHRPALMNACVKALEQCSGTGSTSFYEAAVRVREVLRFLGRPLPARAVGSTLLLKGLEADVAVILDAADHNSRHLYVAMTRGARRLVVCSKSTIIMPSR